MTYSFSEGNYYSNGRGNVVAQITKRTAKYVYINTHHIDLKEACTYRKMIRKGTNGDEYVLLSNSLAIRANKQVGYYDFVQFINKHIGEPIIK